jgi:hypothetical protein
MIDRETSLLALRAENRERIARQCASRRPIREDGKLMVDWFDFRHASATKPTTL